jgi:hypothetical protein
MGEYQPCPVSSLPESRFPNLRNGGFQNAGLPVSRGRNIQAELNLSQRRVYQLIEKAKEMAKQSH